jgi:hypothetical protein
MDEFEKRKKELLTPLLVEAGAALLDCQGFEYGMGLLLFHFSRLGAKGLDPNSLNSIMEDKEKKTAGQLLAMIRKHLGPCANIVTALQEGLAARNRLIHRMLIDNIERCPDQEERRKVISEIKNLRSKVRKANESIQPFVEGLSHALDGVDAEEVRAKALSIFFGESNGVSSSGR